jgi:mannan endo-1,6-alpha-mannosidase
MARAALAAPIIADRIKNMLSASAIGAASACTVGERYDAECEFRWANLTEEYDFKGMSARMGNLPEVFNALEVVQGLLYPSAKGWLRAEGVGSGNGTGNGTQDGGAPQNTGGAASTAATNTRSCKSR